MIDLIASAARKSFGELFARHQEQFYYCSLITTGDGVAPVVSAWSHEALAHAGSGPGSDALLDLKWSYADSPYYAFGMQHFDDVRRHYASLPKPDQMSLSAWRIEFASRIDAMEAAMLRLDSEGLFGHGPERLSKVVLAEVMPPDASNTERARRLNPAAALQPWLDEAAE